MSGKRSLLPFIPGTCVFAELRAFSNREGKIAWRREKQAASPGFGDEVDDSLFKMSIGQSHRAAGRTLWREAVNECSCRATGGVGVHRPLTDQVPTSRPAESALARVILLARTSSQQMDGPSASLLLP
jgi:hypothetical protein